MPDFLPKASLREKSGISTIRKNKIREIPDLHFVSSGMTGCYLTAEGFVFEYPEVDLTAYSINHSWELTFLFSLPLLLV